MFLIVSTVYRDNDVKLKPVLSSSSPAGIAMDKSKVLFLLDSLSTASLSSYSEIEMSQQ